MNIVERSVIYLSWRHLSSGCFSHVLCLLRFRGACVEDDHFGIVFRRMTAVCALRLVIVAERVTILAYEIRRIRTVYAATLQPDDTPLTFEQLPHTVGVLPEVMGHDFVVSL